MKWVYSWIRHRFGQVLNAFEVTCQQLSFISILPLVLYQLIYSSNKNIFFDFYEMLNVLQVAQDHNCTNTIRIATVETQTDVADEKTVYLNIYLVKLYDINYVM